MSNFLSDAELGKPIKRADFDRVSILEQQLIICELKGFHTKATLLRGILRAIKITLEVEAEKLA